MKYRNYLNEKTDYHHFSCNEDILPSLGIFVKKFSICSCVSKYFIIQTGHLPGHTKFPLMNNIQRLTIILSKNNMYECVYCKKTPLKLKGKDKKINFCLLPKGQICIIHF